MAYNTIKVKKYMDIVEEFDANAEIYPGMLVEEMSTGKLRAHSTAEGNAIPMFALEDELQGNDIDDAYAADDKVQVWVPNRGEQVYAILADGQNASIGSFLESHGDGYLQVHEPDIMSWESSAGGRSYTDYSNVIIGVALEAVDLGDSSGAESSGALGYNKRILIRVI